MYSLYSFTMIWGSIYSYTLRLSSTPFRRGRRRIGSTVTSFTATSRTMCTRIMFCFSTTHCRCVRRSGQTSFMTVRARGSFVTTTARRCRGITQRMDRLHLKGQWVFSGRIKCTIRNRYIFIRKVRMDKCIFCGDTFFWIQFQHSTD